MGCSECRHSTATQSPLMGSAWDCTWNCNNLPLCKRARVCVCEKAITIVCVCTLSNRRPLYGLRLQYSFVAVNKHSSCCKLQSSSSFWASGRPHYHTYMCQMSHLLRLPDLQHGHSRNDRVGIFLGGRVHCVVGPNHQDQVSF